MGRHLTALVTLAVAAGCLVGGARADGEDPALQEKLNTRMQTFRDWAANAAVVDAVKAVNANVPAPYAAMTEEHWAELSILDPFVRSFSQNDAAAFLKANKGLEVSEAFVSAANGMKVAFLSKTTSWNHKGKPKHDVPMAGKTWQGEAEIDKSTGLQQIQ